MLKMSLRVDTSGTIALRKAGAGCGVRARMVERTNPDIVRSDSGLRSMFPAARKKEKQENFTMRFDCQEWL